MLKKRKAPKPDSKNAGAPAWMVTYSDMVTLLLTFFVLLLSMSEIDKLKFEQAAGSLQGAFGIMKSKPENDPETEMVIIPKFAPIQYDMMQRVYKQIVQHLDTLELDKDIEVVEDRGAIVLRIREIILFEAGSTTVRREAGPVLEKVVALVSPLPFDMRVEGHADASPFQGSDRTNWDLSIARAVSVLKYFADNELMAMERLSVVGYGDKKPLVPNDTPENMSINRRVEFVLESNGGDYRQQLPYLIDSRDQLPF